MEYTKESIHKIVENQWKYFKTNETLDVNFRLKMLNKLEKGIKKYENELIEALKKDLARDEVEAFLCDIGDTYIEINEAKRNIRRWTRPETHFSGLLCFPSVITKVYKMPYGLSLIISPFNFPVYLSFGPLVASIVGGNCTVIKASSKSPNCTKVMEELIRDTFPPEYVTVIGGSHDVADMLLVERFDKIFYTGSPKVARHITELSAKNLVPLTLELGGENGNWCVVRSDADIRDAARKVAFFKILNAGQICIDINQVAVSKDKAELFIKYLKEEIVRQIGDSPLENLEYPHLITKEAYKKCEDEVNLYKDRILFGGHGDINTQKFEPTIIYPVNKDEGICNHELFSPVIPIIPFDDEKIDDLLEEISIRERGLALYLFTKDKRWANKTIKTLQFGGGCINDVCVHLMVKGVPFNGVGHSGMGAYHGEWGFREFTHPMTILKGSNKFNLPLREHPYTKSKYKLIRMFEK